jgi:Universal stress protein UspA and related nucleotide-binding proteins
MRQHAEAEEKMTTMTTPGSSELQWQYETPAIGGIVVGFDGSPASHAAIQTASAIAAARKCAVHVVSVLQPMSSYKIDLGVDQPRSEVEDLRIQLREAAIRDAIGPQQERANWTRQVAVGRAAQKIAEVAERRKADLVIVGRTQRGVIDRMLGGETTLQVMRLSASPVLVVGEEMKKPNTVVAAVDFSPASVRAAEAGLQMLTGSGTLYLVHVDEPVEVFPDGLVLPEPDSVPSDLLKRLRASASALNAPSGVVVEPVVLSGRPTSAIAEFCDRVGADLLVAGTHGLPRVARFLLGSVSTGFVRNIHKPVVIVPAQD